MAAMYRQGSEDRQLTERNFRAGRGCTININHASNFGISAGSKERQGYLPLDAVLSKIEELSKTYVKTEAMDEAHETLKRYDHVTLSGAPGEGKTSIALMLCEAYHCLNYEIIFVDDLDDFDEKQCYTITSNTCIVMDDIFGTIGISTNLRKLDKTLNTLNEIIKRKLTQRQRKVSLGSLSLGTRPEEVPVEVKVIFTSKTFNLKEGCRHLSQYDVNLFRRETIIDLSAKSLSKDTKRNIIASLQRQYSYTDLPEKDIEAITESSTLVFGFPLTSKLYFSEPVFQMQGVQFFQKPLYYLRRNIDIIIGENSSRKVILILLVLLGGKLDLMSFQENPDDAIPEDIKQALGQIIPDGNLSSVYKNAANFVGTYCVRQGRIVSFSHPTIYDAVTCAMVNMCPLLLLKHCTLKFIFERVQTMKVHDGNDISVDPVKNIVYVNSQYHEILITRIAEHIKQGYFRLTIAHPMFRDEILFLRLLDKIMKHLHEIVLCKDKESGESFLYWCTFSHNGYIVEQTLKCIRHIKEDVIRSIIACIHNGNLKALKMLISQVYCHDGVPFRALATSCKLVCVAASSKHADIFKYLIDNEVDLHTKDDDGKTILHLSCEAGQFGVVNQIPGNLVVEFLHVQDFSGRTPLLMCAEFGHLKLFKLLTEKGADLLATDHLSNTCLHLASMKGHTFIAEFILTKEPSLLGARDSQGRTPIMTAARFGRSEMFSLLLEGSDMCLSDDANENMLCLAALGGSLDIVSILLTFPNTDINKTGEHHRSALSAAAVCGHMKVFDLLLSENAKTSGTDVFGNTCLHHACYGKNVNICKKMFTMMRNQINSTTKVGRTPIFIATKEGPTELVQFLLANAATLDIVDDANNSCLHQACLNGDDQMVKYMLSLKTFDVNKRGRFGWTPLMFSARVGDEKIFKVLLSNESLLSLTDDNNNDLLWLACCGGNASILRYLLSLKTFDINRRGENGYTSVMAAVRKGQKDTFDVACAGGADLRLTDDYDNDLLSLAAAGGDVSIVRHLLSLGLFDMNKRGEAGRTPIMSATRKGNLEIVQVLVEEGADISLTDKQNNNCLSLASKSGDDELVSYLMSLKKFDPNLIGELKRPPVLSAASTGSTHVFNALISHDVDVTVIDGRDCDCLGLAVKGGSASIVRRLLDMKTFNVNRPDHHGYTPILCAIAKGNFKLFEMLLGEETDLTLVDRNGNDCLALAAIGGNVDIVKYLLSLEAFAINKPRDYDLIPVLTAAKYGHQGVFDILVKEKADLSVLDKSNNNCLITAAIGGDINIVKYLLDLKVFDINSRGQSNWTAVMAAIAKGHRKVFELLREEGADLALKDVDGNGCLILACVNDRSDLVRFMLSLNIFDINSRGEGGKTPVMFAALKGHVRTFFLHVSEGADLTLYDDGTVSCEEYALKGEKPPIVRHFLSDDVTKVSPPAEQRVVERKCIVS